MENLMGYICDELEELDRKAEKDKKLSMTEIQYADILAHTKKNLLKADEMYGEEYSMAGGQGGNQGGNYSREYRYSREGGRGGRGGSYRGGSYARGRQNARRNEMGRYSREGYSRGGDNEEYVEQLQDLMQELPPEAQQHVQKAIDKLEQM